MASPSVATRRFRRSLSTSLFLLSAGWASAGAPDYSLDGSVVAASGVHQSTNACLTLSSVVGQPVGGIAQQEPVPTYGYEIDSGFWAIYQPTDSDTLMNDNFEVCQ